MPTKMEIPHPNETENRLAYAQRIIGFLDTYAPGAKAVNLSRMNEASWRKIADLSEEARPPSKSTISMVIGMVRGRELAIESITRSLGDPSRRLLDEVV